MAISLQLARVMLLTMAAVIGYLIARPGYEKYLLTRRIRAARATTVESIREPGLVAIEGAVRCDETVESPFEQAAASVVAWDVLEWSVSASNQRDSVTLGSWVPVAEGIDSVPFRLDDGTGEIDVTLGSHARRPRRYLRAVTRLRGIPSFGPLRCFKRCQDVHRVGVDDTPPAHVQRFLDQREVVRRHGSSLGQLLAPVLGLLQRHQHGDRRYRERALADGDTVFLLAYAQPQQAGATPPYDPQNLVLGPAPAGAPPALFATVGKQSLDRKLGGHLLAMGLGVGIFVLGIYGAFVFL